MGKNRAATWQDGAGDFTSRYFGIPREMADIFIIELFEHLDDIHYVVLHDTSRTDIPDEIELRVEGPDWEERDAWPTDQRLGPVSPAH